MLKSIKELEKVEAHLGERLYLYPVAVDFYDVKNNKLLFLKADTHSVYIPWDIKAYGGFVSFFTGRKRKSLIEISIKKFLLALKDTVKEVFERVQCIGFLELLDVNLGLMNAYYAIEHPRFKLSFPAHAYLDGPAYEGQYLNPSCLFLKNIKMPDSSFCNKRERNQYNRWVAKCNKKGYEIRFIQELDT